MAILSAPDYYSSVSIAGVHDSKMTPVKVDIGGQMYIIMTGQEITVTNQLTDYFQAGQNIGMITGSALNLTVDQSNPDRVIQGKAEGNFPVVALDANGIILSRMKGAASGDLILKILDDCGDTSTIEDWVEGADGLNPVDNQVYVKQGSHSMALGVDADKSGGPYATWENSQARGDLSNYQHDWVYFWVYFETLDYLAATGAVFSLYFGNSLANYLLFTRSKSELSVGWNLIKCDFDNPDGSNGTVDWTAIDFMFISVVEVGGNDNDFTLCLDCIMFVRPTPGAGTLKDIAIDENGVLLSKMTGQYADILKPIAIDQDGLMLAKMTGLFESALKTIAVDTNGVMKANLAVQSLPAMTIRPFYTETKHLNVGIHLEIGEEDRMLIINDPGIINGGVCWADVTDYHDSTLWYIKIDGVEIAAIRLTNLQNYGIDEAYGIPFFILVDESASNLIRLGVQPGLTFETSFEIRVKNSAAETADDFGALLWYSLVP